MAGANGGAEGVDSGTVAFPEEEELVVETEQVRFEVVDVMRPTIARLTDDVLASVVEAVPPFEDWLDGQRSVRDGVEAGLRGFLDLLESGDDDGLPCHDVFFDFGRSEVRQGRSLGALLTAYRVGAQATWRGVSDAGHAAGIEPRALYAIADLIFSYIDRLCAATVEGYAYEQSMTAAERVDGRRRLVELAVRTPPASEAELQAAADDAGWRLPSRLAVIAFRDARASRVAARLPADALVARVDGTGWAIVPDPDGPRRRTMLEQALSEVQAGVGPAVPPAEAAESARQARRALGMARDAPGERLVLADRRRVDLLLLSDSAIATHLVEDVLGPLSLLPASAQERLVETLDAWLEHQGEVRPAAEQLHVHTQTVRYRVAQLRELLGERMASAEGRLELELALRARRLLGMGGDEPERFGATR